jgi:hypothetical protein
VIGKRALGCVESEPIVVGGTRQLRASAGVEETEGNKTRKAAFSSAGG